MPRHKAVDFIGASKLRETLAEAENAESLREALAPVRELARRLDQAFVELDCLPIQARVEIAPMQVSAQSPELLQLADALGHLLRQVGEAGHCRGCGRRIYWIVHRNGKRAPYTQEGRNHFIDCPASDRFRRRAQGGADCDR